MGKYIDELAEHHKSIVREYEKKDKEYRNWLIPILFLMLIPCIHYIGLIGIGFFIIKGFDITKKGEYSRGFLEGFETAKNISISDD